MNNVVFGNDSFTYYETIGGGQGACPHADGPSGVHVAMSNTLNTPAEALELSYPLRVERYELRLGSGGAGRQRGGDGVVRELRVLEPCRLSLLTQRRALAPRGAHGGEDGLPGPQLPERRGASRFREPRSRARRPPPDRVSGRRRLGCARSEPIERESPVPIDDRQVELEIRTQADRRSRTRHRRARGIERSPVRRNRRASRARCVRIVLLRIRDMARAAPSPRRPARRPRAESSSRDRRRRSSLDPPRDARHRRALTTTSRLSGGGGGRQSRRPPPTTGVRNAAAASAAPVSSAGRRRLSPTTSATTAPINREPRDPARAPDP